MSAEFKWYVAHTYSGYENKVKDSIEKTVENRGLSELIGDVCIPVEEAVEENDKGEKKTVSRKIYPGYVFIKMKMTDESWYVVRNTRGCTGFVGPGSKPVPLSDAEVRFVGVEDGAIILCASCDTYATQRIVPLLLCCGHHAIEGCCAHLRLEVLACILHRYI